MTKEWLFEPLDTLFFRNGLSFSKGEGGFLESIFPPTPQTMQGVVRSAVLLSHCKDPNTFGTGKCDTCGEGKKCSLTDIIGSPKEGDYGALNLYGPYLYKDGKRYYPAPLDLMKGNKDDKRLFLLSVSDKHVVPCDLGNISLPAKPDGYSDDFEPAGGWISEDALRKYFESQTVPVEGENKTELLKENDFFVKEPRVGIEREYDTHKVIDGMLYSIVPLRFQDKVKIGLRVDGLDDAIKTNGFATKIGGEGRVCKVDINNDFASLFKWKLNDCKTIKMVMLQPADFSSWLPPDFDKTTLQGSIDGVTLRLISACIGRPQKIGGWDAANNKVKTMKSYVPAGSVYFFEVINGNPAAMKVEGKIGNDNKIGLGHYLLGGVARCVKMA